MASELDSDDELDLEIDEDERDDRDDDGSDDLDDDLDEDEPKPKRSGGGVLSKLRGRPKRPGEQDPLQSPLVMWLIGGTATLALVASILWLVLGRYHRQQAYDAAKAEMDGRRYRQAIKLYEGFLDEHPHGDLADTARIDLARAQVLREIDTATPDWKAGLEQINGFLEFYRDKSIFKEQLQPDAFEYAKKIALGTAKEAERSESPELLSVHDPSAKLALRYVPADDLEDLQANLERVSASARAAIHRRETYDEAMAAIDGFLEAGDPLAALDRRVALLDQFADYADDGDLNERFAAAMDAEVARTRVEAVNQDAETTEPPEIANAPTGPTLALHTRTSEDTPVGTRRVVTVAGGTLFACDATTGTPIWKRPVGGNQPFFPILTEGSVPGVLVFDTLRYELVHLELESGRLLWRQVIGEDVSTEPLVAADGLVYVPTASGAVHQVELERGKLLALAQCSQPVLTTPADVDGNRVVVVGDRGVAYVFATRPMALVEIVHLGHRTGTMADVLPMRPYVLVVENDRHDSARLRLFDGTLGKRRPDAVGEARVEGRVHDDVSVRGSQLLVPFGRERAATFVVSAEEGQPPILRTAVLNRDGLDVDAYLLPGPADEFWIASTALRRYQIRIETIQQVPGEAARGFHVQPMQSIGEDVFVGYRPVHASSIYLVKLNRRSFQGDWRTVFADRIAATIALPNGSVACATESGQVYRVTAESLAAGGFVEQGSFSVPVGDDTTSRLLIGRGANSIGIVGTDREGKHQLWVVNQAGVLDWQVELPARPQLPPVPLAGGFVVAYPGRLSLVMRTRARIDDFQANVAPGQETQWTGLSSLGKDAVVAQDSAGGLVKIGYRPTPLPHLASLAALEGGERAVVPVGAGDAAVAVVDASNTLRLHASNRFEELATKPLGAAASRAPWVVGNLGLVETRDGKLHGLGFGFGAGQPWTLPLEGAGLAGPPLLGTSGLTVALRDGRVLTVNPADGTVTSTKAVGSVLAGGPMKVGELIVVPTAAASLIPITGGAE